MLNHDDNNEDYEIEQVLCPETDVEAVLTIHVGLVDSEPCVVVCFICPVCEEMHQAAMDITDVAVRFGDFNETNFNSFMILQGILNGLENARDVVTRTIEITT